MILIQLLGVILLIGMANLAGILIFGVVKDLFFYAYIKDKENNIYYRSYNWIEYTIVSVLILIAINWYFSLNDEFPNKTIVMLVAFAIQVFIIYNFSKQRFKD